LKIILFANTDWYLYNYRLGLAHEILARGHELILLSPDGPYAKKLKDLSFTWKKIDLDRKGGNPIHEIRTLVEIFRLYSYEKPDLVHHFTVKCIIYGSLAAKFTGIPKIVNAVTGLGYIFLNNDFKTRIIRQVVKCFYQIALRNTQVIFQNEDDLNTFIENKLVKQNQSTVISGSGVDTTLLKPAKASSGIPVVLLVSRMLKDKGIHEFVNAARMIKGEGIKARFVLVGDVDEGNPASLSRNELEAWQNEDVVEWWGWQDDVVGIYQQASVVCLPSYREGISKSLIEAAACGKPLVTTDVPGCRDVVLNDKNGFLVPPRDSTKLAEAISLLIGDERLRERMGKQSRQIAINHFSLDKIIHATLQLYKEEMVGGK